LKPVAAVVFVALCFATTLGATPARDGAWGAVDRVQDARHEARKLAAAGRSPEDLRKAASILEDALAYLATPSVRAWAEGNRSLYFRSYDALRDLAAVYVAQGRRDDALSALEAMQAIAYVPPVASMLEGDEKFAPLRSEPRFRAIVATLQATDRLWKVPNIATPYKETLGVEERIAGLSLFWAEARQSFVYFDHVPNLEWDRAYLDFLPRAMAATTVEEYYRVLMQFAALLHDGHTNVYPPDEISAKFYSRPPIGTERLDGHVYVTLVASPSLATRVRVGDEIVAIDGEKVDDYARERVAPYVSSSTPQDRDLRTYGYQLLLGDEARTVRLLLRAGDGRERTEILERTGYSDVAFPEPFEFRMLPGEIAYFAFGHMDGPEGVVAFERALPAILAAKGLVLDLRRNGGGSTTYGLQVLSYLTPEPLKVARQRFRDDPGYTRVGAPTVTWAEPVFVQDAVIPRKQHFTGPVAMLIGPRTFSAAEDLAMSFDVAKRGVLVGSASGGSTGQPLFFKLPGGGSARICVKRDTYPDGREFVGKGILPDIPMAATADDLRAGRDPVLERAVAELAKPR
jgi:carboxyl-terminal processing protease